MTKDVWIKWPAGIALLLSPTKYTGSSNAVPLIPLASVGRCPRDWERISPFF
jgi:hypothetical protein